MTQVHCHYTVVEKHKDGDFLSALFSPLLPSKARRHDYISVTVRFDCLSGVVENDSPMNGVNRC